MDEYNDPDTVRLGKSFCAPGDSPLHCNGQRTMSLCIDQSQGGRTTVVRNISSPPAMPATGLKRLSLRASLRRLTGGRKDSLHSIKERRNSGAILETGEVSPTEDPKELSIEKEKVVVIEEPEGQLHLWFFYFKKCGWSLIVSFSLASCFYQTLKMYSDVWLNGSLDEGATLEEVRG